MKSQDVKNKASKKLKEWREKEKMSQEVLAKRFGVTKQSVSYWEHSQKIPKLNIIKELQEIAGISLNDWIS